MQDRGLTGSIIFAIPDVALECVMIYLDDPRDRSAVSLVCKRWHYIDYLWKATPLEWGGSAGPWISEISETVNRLKSLHFRRMVVTDKDLAILVRGRGHMLNDGESLHELALNNIVLEVLNFNATEVKKVNIQDLELLARNCSNLISLKISDCEILDLVGVFRRANALEEFGGGYVSEPLPGEVNKYENLYFLPRLARHGLSYMSENEMPMIFPFAASLKKLDLQCTLLNTEDHVQLIRRCPNLEVLEVRNVISDRRLEVVAQHWNGSQRGVSALAEGCPELEYLAVYVSDIANAALNRLPLFGQKERITDLPLDNGVRALLRGCQKLRSFAFYAGILEFSRGCPVLQKLELRRCCFSESALAEAIINLASLRYLWVQGYRASPTGRALLRMTLPFWNIEIIPPTIENGMPDEVGDFEMQAQILAYYSLAGRRDDHHGKVIPLSPLSS
ncbi:hypothetical protein AMTRI_Chr08g160030 [Amborella trichopoda]